MKALQVKISQSIGSTPRTFLELLHLNIDIFKGLLIIVVIMDHNDLLRALASDLFKPLTFHVLGFLALPFLVAQENFSASFIRDRLVRYLVPFWLVMSVVSAVYNYAYNPIHSQSQAIILWAEASLIGSAALLKICSGFYYLWFLPCLAGLVISIAAFNHLQRTYQILAFALSFCAHVSIGLFPRDYIGLMPFGILIILWIFPLGIFLRYAVLSPLIFKNRYLIFACFFVGYTITVFDGKIIEVMTLDVPSFGDPLMLSVHDVTTTAGVLMCIWLGKYFTKSSFVKALGRHSMMVYLVHPIFFFILMKLTHAPEWALDRFDSFLMAALSVFLTAKISLTFAAVVQKFEFSRTWITPKGWYEWGPVVLHHRLKSSHGP